jgi:hypothetical protein
VVAAVLPTAAAPMLKNGFEARLGCCGGKPAAAYIPFYNIK